MKQCWQEVYAVDVTGKMTLSSCWQFQQVTLLGFVVLRISQKAHVTMM